MSVSTSYLDLGSFINTLGGLDQFYSVTMRKDEITLQAKYSAQVIRNVHGCFEQEIGTIDAVIGDGWAIDINGYLSIEIKYNDTVVKVCLTD